MKQTMRATLRNRDGIALHWEEIRWSPKEMTRAMAESAARNRLDAHITRLDGDTIVVLPTE